MLVSIIHQMSLVEPLSPRAFVLSVCIYTPYAFRVPGIKGKVKCTLDVKGQGCPYEDVLLYNGARKPEINLVKVQLHGVPGISWGGRTIAPMSAYMSRTFP